MRPPPAVVFPIARSKIKGLSALPGFPHLEEGIDRLAQVLQEVAVSLEHADAILATFQDRSPTFGQLREVAYNLKPQFVAPPPDPRIEWERKYGSPQPVPLLAPLRPYRRGEWPAAGSAEERQMNKYIRERVGKKLAAISWGEYYLAAEEWGVRLNGAQRNLIPSTYKLPPKPETNGAMITPADIEQAVRQRRAAGETPAPLILPEAFEGDRMTPAKPFEETLRYIDEGVDTGRDRDDPNYHDPEENGGDS